MIAGPVGRRDQQKEEMYLFAIQALKIDPFRAHAHGADEAIDAGMLGVRHGDAAADTSASQLFALHDRLDDALLFGGLDLAGGDKRTDQFLDDRLFIKGGKVSLNRRFADKIREFHSEYPFTRSCERALENDKSRRKPLLVFRFGLEGEMLHSGGAIIG